MDSEGERIFKDKIGHAKSSVNFSALVTKMKADITLIMNDMSATPPIVRIFPACQILVHQQSTVPQRLFYRVDRRQFFIFHVNQPRGFFGDPVFYRGDRRYHVAHIANFVRRQNLLVFHVSAKSVGCNVQVVAADNGDHAG